MLEAFHNGKFEYKKLSLEEQQRRGILGRLTGILADTTEPTRNGRLYSKKLWEHVFNDPIMKEKIANRCVFMELGHPVDRTEIDMEKICACLAEQPKIGEDGKIYGTVDILDTQNGRLLKTLCDYGTNVGISSRGEGDLITNYDGQEEVDPDTYSCETWDIVLVPAIKSARLQYVTESLDKKRYNKTLRKSLQESLDKASDEDRKIMEETLTNLHIDLDEGRQDHYIIEVSAHDIDADEVLRSWNLDSRARAFEFVNNNPSRNLEVIYRRFINGQLDGIQVLARPTEPAEASSYAKSNKKVNIYIDGEWVPKDTDPQVILDAINNPDMVCLTGWGSKITEALTEAELNIITEAFNNNKVLAEAFESYEPSFYEELKEAIQDQNLNEGLNVSNLEQYYNSAEQPEKDIINKCINKVCKSDCSINELTNKQKADVCELVSFISNIGTQVITRPKKDIKDECLNINEQIMENGKENYLVIDDNYQIIGCVEGDSYDDCYEQAKQRFGKGSWHLEESYNKYITDKNPNNINEEKSTVAVDNNEAVVEELQKFIKVNAGLEQKIVDLQEQLSVCYAKESKNEEEVVKYKNTIQKLAEDSKQAKALQAKVSLLESKLNDTNEQNSKLKDQLSEARERVNISAKKNQSLNESISNKTGELSKLTESINTLKQSLTEEKSNVEQAQKALKESQDQTKQVKIKYKQLKESAEKEQSKLNENIAQLQKDINLQKTEYSQKVEKAKKIVEKYKKATTTAIDKYIELQAVRLGSSVNEVKNRLPESYTFEDIDKACEDLQSYNLNMSKLPFNTLARKSINENIKIKGTPSRNESLLPVNGLDDDIDEDLMYLAGK